MPREECESLSVCDTEDVVLLDGGKGLRRTVREVFGAQAQIQRCIWHKRENVVAYLPKHLQAAWRAKLQHAYRQPTYAAARSMLDRLHGELRRPNRDAVRSLAEGIEETLTLADRWRSDGRGCECNFNWPWDTAVCERC